MDLKRLYDAIVVGSGATGGWAAKELAEQGMEVLVLEAGRALTADDSRVNVAADGQPASAQSIQMQHPAFHAGNRHFFIDDTQNPYSHPADAPFVWIRGRQVGGRSMVWGGQTWRLSDLEFKAANSDGVGLDWPLRHADLAPHYERVERLIGIRGNRDGLPGLPDCETRQPADMTEAEVRLEHAVKARWPDRRVIGVRSASTEVAAASFGGEACWPRFSSPGSTLSAAERTGRMTLRANSVVSHLLMSADETLVRGVSFMDARDGSVNEVFGKAVVLCASTLESTRMLLNTRSARYARGIGDRSGCLGRYLMDHVAIGIHGIVPDLMPAPKSPAESAAPTGTRGVYVPRFRNVGSDTHPGFRRGYGLWGRAQRDEAPGPATFSLFAIGEMLPDVENHVEITSQSDAWGVPTLHIHCRFGENEHRMAEDARAEALRMAESAGFVFGGEIPMFTPGRLVHEVGTARMGTDRASSYLNPVCQSWEIPNLFVTDGACWTTSAYQNPTLTMMAITSYACPHIRNEVARR